MKFYTQRYVKDTDIEAELNIHIFDTICAENAVKDSFVYLVLNDDYYEEIKDDIEWHQFKAGEIEYLTRLQNELKIIEYFRNLGIKDNIYIYIS